MTTARLMAALDAFATIPRKFVRLETSERRLLVRTVYVLVVIRLALRVLPFRVLCTLMPHPEATADGLSTEVLVCSVMRAARCIQACTCLERAMALHILLARSGYRSCLTIGFQRGASARRGHAWVEYAGQTFFDGDESARYVPAFSIGGFSARS